MDTFVFTASGSRAAFVESSMLLYSRTRKFVGVGHLTRPPGAAAAPQSRREGAGHLAWSRPAVRARSAAPGRGRGWRRPRHPPHTRAAPREPTRKRRLRLSTISLFNRILHISCGGLLPGEGRGAGWGSTAVPPPQPDPLQTGPAPSAEPHRGWPRGGGRWLGSAGRHRGARRAGQGPGLRASVVSSPHPRRRDAPPPPAARAGAVTCHNRRRLRCRGGGTSSSSPPTTANVRSFQLASPGSCGQEQPKQEQADRHPGRRRPPAERSEPVHRYRRCCAGKEGWREGAGAPPLRRCPLRQHQPASAPAPRCLPPLPAGTAAEPPGRHVTAR